MVSQMLAAGDALDALNMAPGLRTRLSTVCEVMITVGTLKSENVQANMSILCASCGQRHQPGTDFQLITLLFGRVP